MKDTIQSLTAEMHAAVSDYRAAATKSLQASLLIGDIGKRAKTVIPHGQLMLWIETNFDVSGTWVRVCMRATKAWPLLNEQYPHRVVEVSNVEMLARMVGPLQRGEDPFLLEPRYSHKGTAAALRAEIRELRKQLEGALKENKTLRKQLAAQLLRPRPERRAAAH